MVDGKNVLSEADDGGTRVDLGEDLLEKSGILPRDPAVPPPHPESSIPSPSGEFLTEGTGNLEDMLQSAKILISEGFMEDAKKVLRQIIIGNPNNIVAKQSLEGIHSLELKQIFDGSEFRRPFDRTADLSSLEVDAEGLMRQLDRDLNLGVFTEGSPSQNLKFSLFEEPEVVAGFCNQLERSLVNGTAQDWIDMGVAFIEMELYSIAARLFMGVYRHLGPDGTAGNQMILSATSLLAYSLFLSGRPFEAISRIQPVLQDGDIKREDKIEFFYLMGRIYESMKDPEKALQFFAQVSEIDSHYRDVAQLLRKKH